MVPVFSIHDLTVETNGVRRLDRLTLSLARGEMLGVLGGSGAGKSTLFRAITGSDPATSGRVSILGLDLAREYDRLRGRVGYVPQDDVLHSALTVADTLGFAAELRMSGTGADERARRVQDVVTDLGLAHRLDARVSELSGGQRKRVNVALELLSKPELLILDEPTSGLDPANERSLMQLLRGLADAGRTVLVVTHSTESLHLCDRVLFLARGGLPVYLGPPAELPMAFSVGSLVEAFASIDNHPDPHALRQRFDASRTAERTPTPVLAAPSPGSVPTRARDGSDLAVLLRRSVAILKGDRRNLVILAVQAPIIAVLMLLVFGQDKLVAGTPESSGGASVLLALVLSVVFMGATAAVREIVKERSLVLREQAIGVSTVAYVASKAVFLGALVVAQASVVVAFGLARQGTPDDSATPFGWMIETLAATSIAGVGSVALGLLLSSVVTTTDKAMTLLPVLLFVQLLLAGIIFPLDTPLVRQLSWVVNSHWGLNAVGSSADLWQLRGCSSVAGDVPAPPCSRLWQSDLLNYGLSTFMLVALAAGALVGTWFVLMRRDPASVLARRVARAGTRP
jgi:ABC-type multidrug transport system ATPase subunit